ncbi:MAG: ABC transporter, permease protein [Candidatus Wolfebacteria bacterium GW2011_GWA2_47_9b]|uniref:ABC transporter, permease protein n=1 Tax=Candidatus Wolfebacteria bacterium GW2011_GWA2_47_9b TaxID=1619005 RepID=A0A0G1U5T4_9BACT|nr:MAG: ABC transporter, permease protein [Candidatus Wolfebacteria bacterium GW2011_GWA2_47_9b]
MTIVDIIEETYSALSGNKVRSGLTMLGIIIGISSVIAMVAIGQGAQGSIQSSIQSIGSNLVLVMPGQQRGAGTQISAGRGSARSLTQGDADAIIKEVSLAKAVAPEISGRYQITSKGKNTNTSVIGTTAAYLSIRNIEIDFGSFITDQNVRSLSKVAVLGPTTRDDLFGEGVDAVGQTIRIKNIEFKVIGIAKTKGGSGFSNPDDTIFIPLSSAQRFLAGDTYVTTISVQAESAESMTDIQQQISVLLMERHHISDMTLADFNIMNQADIIATASTITQTFTILLAAIAGISLVVGGIGIMNMMLTTVTERTREIGLRKAIGAKKRDISLQFLIEAIILTFIGGFVGVLLGWMVSFGVTYFNLLQTQVTFTSVQKI